MFGYQFRIFMQERKYLKNLKFFAYVLACTWILSAICAGMPASRAALGNNTTLSQDFTLNFNKAWNDGTINENDVTVPDVASVVDNITSYVDTGYTAYVGTQVPTKTLNRYWYVVNATHVYIYDNHDTSTDGDIYLRGEINQLVDDQMSNTKAWDYYLGQFPDYTHSPLMITLYAGWAAYIAGRIELYDDDGGIVDSYGIWEFWWNQTKAGFYYNITYGGGDAIVTYSVQISAGPVAMNAAALLDAYKLYLWEDMETSYHDPPAMVCGRVIEGYDAYKGKNTSCLQYIYAYANEYSGTDVFVHYWDWEMVLIFVDLSAGSSVNPYRLVWDNGWYFGSEGGTDWMDGQRYYIYEENAVPGSYYMDVEFSSELWPLLGKSRQMTYEVYEISDLFDTGIENWGIFEWGLPSFQATIETSYHQFDIGDSNGLGSTPFLRGYSVQQLNNTILAIWYKCLDYSWTQGIHEVGSGHYTPNYAPFSWDVMQPFTRPYILNNYPKLCVDINAYNGAKEKKSFNVDVKKSIGVTLQVPCTLELTIPESGAPGDPVSTSLNFHLHPEKANLTLDVFLNFSAQVNLFFGEYSWDAVFDKKFFLDFANPVLQTLGELVKLTTDSTFTFSNVNLGSYVTLNGAINPQLLGTILDMEVQIHLAEILKALIGPSYSWIVDTIVDSLDLVINPQITGYLAMDVFGGGTQIGGRAQFTAVEQSIPVTFTLPAGSASNFLLEIKNIAYGINFMADWSLGLVWGQIPALVCDDQNWQLGVWPNIDIVLAEGTAALTSIAKYTYDTSSSSWKLEGALGNPTTPPGGIPGYPIAMLLLVSLGVISIIAARMRHRR